MAKTEAITLPPVEPLLLAIGDGMQRFSMVEIGLAMVLNAMLGSGLGTAILDAGRHFEVRLRIMNAVAAATLGVDDLKTAKNLLGRAKRRAEIRNKLAHWQVSGWPPAKTAAEARKMKFVLIPPVGSARFGELMIEPKSEGEAPLTLAQIRQHTALCGELHRELSAFATRLQQAKRKGKDPA